MKWVVYIAGALVLAAAAAVVAGSLLPQGHTASRTAVYDAPPPAVFEVITTFERQPEWRAGISVVEVFEGTDGLTRVREHGRDGIVTYKVEVREPPSRLRLGIDDPSLPFGGTWTYELSEAPEGTALTITENGEIYNPLFRLMARLFFSPYATIDSYQADLRERLRAVR